MRTYYELIQHLKTLLEEDNDVNTIVTDGYIDMDNYRKNIFPVCDIFVVSSPYIESTAVTRYVVEVTVLDIRDYNKEEINDKFYLNDNRHDSWNLTRGILKRLTNKLIKDTHRTDITLVSASDAERKSYVKENGLDGWLQTMTIDVPDLLTTVC